MKSYIIHSKDRASDKFITIKNVFDQHTINILKKILKGSENEFIKLKNESLDYVDKHFIHKRASELVNMKLKSCSSYQKICEFFDFKLNIVFSGRFLKIDSNDTELPWHNDFTGSYRVKDRIMGFSIYLDDEKETNTSFEMKYITDDTPFLKMQHKEIGDINMFIIDKKLEHRVKSSSSKFERNTFSGWGYKRISGVSCSRTDF